LTKDGKGYQLRKIEGREQKEVEWNIEVHEE
jgi:hypothetical protein